MGHTYRTEPDPPEEPTEQSDADARETAEALRNGAWIAISSVFGLALFVVALIQLTRVLTPSSPYGSTTLIDWLLLGVIALAFVVVLTIGRWERAD
ncbi:hypothetical protein [Halopiger djelfimassiliensis]|uniref:hypothetical protein n=1 Tax=Halopiger djelfimassiliensis TaxID=1293047 RepID=UPI0006777BA7|nr:hypothetical protein [Halopiger djelfimassiliensis]